MPLGRAPDLAFGPEGQVAQLLHLGVGRFDRVGERQAVRIEDADFGAIAAQDAGRLLRQEPRIGPLPQRTVEHQDARRVGHAFRLEQARLIDGSELTVVDVRRIGIVHAHSAAPPALTISPSSLV
jgi:hypothetical protein